MKTIKQKPTNKTPRELSPIKKMPKQIIHKILFTTKDNIQAPTKDKNTEESPQQYASNKIEDNAKDTVKRAEQRVKGTAQKAIRNIKQKLQHRRIKQRADKRSYFFEQKSDDRGNANETNSTNKHNTNQSTQTNKSPKISANTPNTNNQVTHTPKPTTNGNMPSTTQSTAKSKAVKQRLISNKRTAKLFRHNIKTTQQVTKGIKSTVKNTVKTTKKTVKSARMAVKTGTRAIKTTAQAAKMTARAAQATARAAKVALQAAKAAAKAAITAIKLTIKAIIAGIKIAIAAIKALIAAIAAGGWIVVLIILIIAVIVMVIGTLFGVFFADEAQEGEPLKTAITQISEDFQISIDNQIANIQNTVPHTNTKIIYTGSMDGDSDTVNNWSDVLAIYTVKTMYESDETISITPEKQAFLQQVFDDMNNCKITYDVTTEEVQNEDTEQTEEIVTLNIYVEVDSITAEECAVKYNFNDEQLALLKELMSPAYNSYFAKITGIDIYGGETSEDLKDIISNLPTNERAKIIIETAMSRLGDPYSQPKRGQGRYIDCSWLTYIAYKAAGINIPTTSVEQAKYCYDNGYNIGQSELQPGDLVFWSKTTCGCGRWNEIHHVGIYLGNNQVIEASSSKGRVVIQELWGLNGGKWQVFSFVRVMR